MKLLQKHTIIAKNTKHLLKLIKEHIELYGTNCDLNHIDVSNIKNMAGLFRNSDFNGDISRWNTSHVTNMYGMFFCAKFNNDISQWNVGCVEDMANMFCHSHFNGNISDWDVSNVKEMDGMFYNSAFNGNLDNWTPYKAHLSSSFDKNNIEIPYWANYIDVSERKAVIDNYCAKRQLQENLEQQLQNQDKKLINHKNKL